MSKSRSQYLTKKEQERENIWMEMLMVGGPIGLVFILIDIATGGKVTEDW